MKKWGLIRTFQRHDSNYPCQNQAVPIGAVHPQFHGEKRKPRFADTGHYEITSNVDLENEFIMTKLIVQESKRRCVVLITHKEFPIDTEAVIHNL